ncbi:MAG: hypothetical protein ACI86H_002346, partial [bacterium]
SAGYFKVLRILAIFLIVIYTMGAIFGDSSDLFTIGFCIGVLIFNEYFNVKLQKADKIMTEVHSFDLKDGYIEKPTAGTGSIEDQLARLRKQAQSKKNTKEPYNDTPQVEQAHINTQTKKTYNTPQAEQTLPKEEFEIPFNKFYSSSFFQKLKYQKCPNSSCDFLVTTDFDSCPKCGRGYHGKKKTLNQKNKHITDKLLEIKNRINKLNQIIEDQKKYDLKDLAQSTTLAMQKIIRQEEGFQLKQWDLKLVLLVNQIEPLSKNWRKLGELLEKQEDEFDQIIKYHKTNIDSLDNLKTEFGKKDFQAQQKTEFHQKIDGIKSVQIQMLTDLMASQVALFIENTTHHQSISDDEVLNSIDLLHAYHEIGTFSKGLEKLEDEYDSLLSEQNLVDA